MTDSVPPSPALTREGQYGPTQLPPQELPLADHFLAMWAPAPFEPHVPRGCDHVMRSEQHWDECIKCGARWHPDYGFNVPMR